MARDGDVFRVGHSAGRAAASLFTAQAQTLDGYIEALYQDHCALCHDGSMPEAPTRDAIQQLTPATIYQSMMTGVMREQARGPVEFRRERLATYLGAAANDAQRREATVPLCEGPNPQPQAPGGPVGGRTNATAGSCQPTALPSRRKPFPN